jgi:hypothetical protein
VRTALRHSAQSEGGWLAARFGRLLSGAVMENGNRGGQEGTAHETQEEAKKIRRLQVMISMVSSVIGQDPNLTVEEASELVAGAKRAALAMFPDKELAFDILYKPRLQRLMKERFRIQ